MTHTHSIRFSRWGLAENPLGLHVIMPDGSLREVYETYRREFPSAIMLKVRSFDREILDEITAGAARILDRAWKPQ